MHMMSMMGTMMGFMVLGALFFIVVLAVAIWLLVSFLNRRQTPPLPYTPPPQNPYQRYGQGYQPAPTMPEAYQEGGQRDRSSQPKQQFDQPSVPYPQEQEMPPQS
jgi:hypothetical protein